MATGDTDTPKQSKSIPPEKEAWYNDLSSENKVAFRQAKLAVAQAQAAYDEAKRTAKEECEKPKREFGKAKDAYFEALAKLTGKDGVVDRAQGTLNRLREEAGDTKALKLIDPDRPDEGKDQIAKLQGTLDDYKACVAAVAAQMQAVDDASLALQKLSKPKEGKFKPEDADMSETAETLAEEQMNLTIAQAQIPFDAALDAFDRKVAELEGSKPRVLQ